MHLLYEIIKKKIAKKCTIMSVWYNITMKKARMKL